MRHGFVLAAVVALAGGCAMPRPGIERLGATPPRVVASPADEVVYPVARREAWTDVKRIARLFGHAPAECPGLNALAADVEQLQRRIEREGRAELDEIDARTLVTANLHFWRAHLELAASDPLPILFAGLVYLSAGETGQAHELLRLLRAGPLLPEPIDRVLNLHLARTLEPSLPEIGTIMVSTETTPAEKVSALAALREAHPERTVVAHALIAMRRVHAGLPTDPQQEAGRADLVEQVLEASADEVQFLERSRPITALLYRKDRDERQLVLRHWPTWQQMAEPRSGCGPADFEVLADLFARCALPEQALFARRLMMAARGFPVPPDRVFVQRELERVLGPAGADLLAGWERGEIRQIAFFGPDVPPVGDRYRPLHPVVAETLERARRGVNFLLEMPINNPQRMAAAYGARADVLRQLNRLDEAAADLGRHVALQGEGRRSAWLRFHLALDAADSAAAADAFAELVHWAPEDPETFREEGILRTLQGRWDEAGAAFARCAQAHREVEAGGFAALHAIVMYRLGGYEVPEELWTARDRTPPGSWINLLLAACADPPLANELLRQAADGATELDRVGRRCEALFVLAALAPVGSDEARVHLENCVQTGVADFVEYQLARLILRRLDPDRWDPQRRPPEPPPPAPTEPAEPDSLDRARPRPVAPA